MNQSLKVEDIIKKSDNLKQGPLEKLHAQISKEVNSSKQLTKWIRNMNIDDSLEDYIDSIVEDIYEQFYDEKYQVKTIKTDEFMYTGTVNKFGKPEGIGRLVTANNIIHEGSFKNGQATGYGRKFEPNGSMFLGVYHQGIRQGQGILIDKYGVEKKGVWKHYDFDG